MGTKNISLMFKSLKKVHSAASRHALEFFGEFVAASCHPSAGPPKAIVCAEGYNKFLCGNHAESNYSRKGFAMADRVVASISPVFTPGFVSLTFRFFRTDENQPFGEMNFSFGADGPAGAGYSMPS